MTLHTKILKNPLTFPPSGRMPVGASPDLILVIPVETGAALSRTRAQSVFFLTRFKRLSGPAACTASARSLSSTAPARRYPTTKASNPEGQPSLERQLKTNDSYNFTFSTCELDSHICNSHQTQSKQIINHLTGGPANYQRTLHKSNTTYWK